MTDHSGHHSGRDASYRIWEMDIKEEKKRKLVPSYGSMPLLISMPANARVPGKMCCEMRYICKALASVM